MAKSIFTSKIFQAAAITLVSGMTAISVKCVYAHRAPTEEEAIAVLGLFTTFGLTVAGRVNTAPVYTPIGLPGPNPPTLSNKDETETSSN